MFQSMSLQFKISLSIGVIVFTILSFLTVYTISKSRDVAYNLILNEIKSETKAEANYIYAQYLNLKMPIDGLGHAIRGIVKVNRDYNIIVPMIDDFLSDPNHNMATKFLLYFEPSYANFNLESSREGSEIKTYNDVLNTEWYKITKATLKPYTTDMYESADGWIYLYSMPVMLNNAFIGAIAIEVSAKWLEDYIASIVPFNVGSAYLLDDSGRLIGVDRVRDGHLLGVNIYDSGWSGYKERDFINVLKAGKSLVFRKPSSTFQSGWDSIYQLVPIPLLGGKYWGLVLQVSVPDMLREINDIRTVTIIVSVISFIVLMIFLFFIMRYFVIIAIKKLNEEAKYIAEGNLAFISDEKILNRKDEMGMLASSFMTIKSSITKIVNLINESTSEIKTIALTLSEGNSNLAVRTENQSMNIERTSANMQEMSATIKSSTEFTLNGNKMMTESKVSIESGAGVIEETAQNIEDVYDASSKIDHITKIIESIAFQTNILALNAAVEAARAGEQGRGFAVVASEVRNLALTTQSSVNDISKLIEDSNVKIKVATETARTSKEIFTDIKVKIDNTSEIMQELSSSALEQQLNVDQVNTAIMEINEITQQNVALVEELSSTDQLLVLQAQNLVSLMEFFKTTNMKDTDEE